MTTSSNLHRRAPRQPPSPCPHGPPCPTSSLESRCSSEYERWLGRGGREGLQARLTSLVPAASRRRIQSRSPFPLCSGRLLPTYRPTVSAGPASSPFGSPGSPQEAGAAAGQGRGRSCKPQRPHPALPRTPRQRRGRESSRCPVLGGSPGPNISQLSPPRASSGGRPTPKWSGKCSRSTTWVSGPGLWQGHVCV